MIKYVCRYCNNLECDTSICPSCGKRAEIEETKIFWSKKLNVPVFEINPKDDDSDYEFIGTDLRPVFPEERLLLEVLLDKPMQYADSSIWNVGGNKYIVDGKKYLIKFSQLSKQNPSHIISELDKYKIENLKYSDNYENSEIIKLFIKENKKRLEEITTEAINYIKDKSKHYDVDSMFVSFSGGKDSTVTSDLVTKALGNKGIIHIYGDTTLEYPETINYINRLKQHNPNTPILVAKNMDQDFNNLCEVIGPPSRIMRWCCTIFKTGAITKKLR